MTMRTQYGGFLIEVLLALGIFFVLMGGAVSLSFRYLHTLGLIREQTDLNIVAAESFDAIQSIAYNRWEDLADGIYGLTSQDGSWQFQENPDLVSGTYTRTVTVDSVSRDVDCVITSTLGASDPYSKRVSVTLAWQITGAAKSTEFSQHFINWEDSTTCVPDQAEDLLIDISQASLNETQKSLLGVTLINTDSVDAITLDKMTITWTRPANIKFIKIEGTDYWHASNGIGTPQGVQPSGTELDLVDVVLEPGDHSIDTIRFDGKIAGSTLTITATMTDGSSVTSPPFIP